MSQYYYRVFGAVFGPISLELLMREIACGQMSEGDEIRCGNETSWTRVADFMAQQLTKHNPTLESDRPILDWKNGHDDAEAMETVGDAHGTKTVNQWFCRRSTVVRGPYTFDDLCLLVRRGELVAADEVSLRTHSPWTTVGSIGPLTAEMHSWLPESTCSASPAMNAVVEADFHKPVLNLAAQPPERESVEAATHETPTQWYVRMGQVERGPMEFQKLIDLAAAGRLLPQDRVRQGAMSEWTMAKSVPALFSNDFTSHVNAAVSPSAKSKLTQPVGAALGGYSLQPGRTPVMPASVRQASTPSLPSAAAHSTYSRSLQPELDKSSSSSEAAVPRSMVGSYDLTTRLTRPPSEAAPISPQTQPAKESTIEEVQSLDHPVSSSTQILSGESKHKLRRGQYTEPQFDRKTFFLITGAILLFLYGWRLIPATLQQFEAPYNELIGIYDVLDKRLSENPTIEARTAIRKEFVHKIRSIEQKIDNLNSQHDIRAFLIAACHRMTQAAKSEESQEAMWCMKDVKRQLDTAASELQNSKNPAERNEKRVAQPSTSEEP